MPSGWAGFTIIGLQVPVGGQFGGLQAALDSLAQIVGNVQPYDSLRLSAVVKQLNRTVF